MRECGRHRPEHATLILGAGQGIRVFARGGDLDKRPAKRPLECRATVVRLLADQGMRICSADGQQRVVVISVRQTRYETLQKETKIYKERVAREVLAMRRLAA